MNLLEKLINKKKILIIAGLSIVIVAIIVAFTLFYNSDERAIKNLNKNLMTLGEKFYTTFYYEQVTINRTEEEVIEFVKKYEEIGIKVDINNLERTLPDEYKELISKLKYKDTNCDKEKTKAIIYPKKPYDKNSYKLGTILECGIEKSEQ